MRRVEFGKMLGRDQPRGGVGFFPHPHGGQPRHNTVPYPVGRLMRGQAGSPTTSEGGNDNSLHDYKGPFPDGVKGDECYTPDHRLRTSPPCLPQAITIWDWIWGTADLTVTRRKNA